MMHIHEAFRASTRAQPTKVKPFASPLQPSSDSETILATPKTSKLPDLAPPSPVSHHKSPQIDRAFRNLSIFPGSIASPARDFRRAMPEVTGYLKSQKNLRSLGRHARYTWCFRNHCSATTVASNPCLSEAWDAGRVSDRRLSQRSNHVVD